MSRTDRVHYIVPASQKAAANSMLQRENETAATRADGLPTGLSSDGLAPASHWWAAQTVTDQFKSRLPALIAALPGTVVFYESSGNTRANVLARLGLKIVSAEE